MIILLSYNIESKSDLFSKVFCLLNNWDYNWLKCKTSKNNFNLCITHGILPKSTCVQNPPDKILYFRYLLIILKMFWYFSVYFLFIFHYHYYPLPYPRLVSGSQIWVGGFLTYPITDTLFSNVIDLFEIKFIEHNLNSASTISLKSNIINFFNNLNKSLSLYLAVTFILF